MKTLIVLLSLSSLFFLQSGCSGISEDERYYQLIQGDWVTKKFDRNTPYDAIQFSLSFTDSTLIAMDFTNWTSKFKIRQNILYVWYYANPLYFRNLKHTRFRIIGLYGGTLKLLPMDNDVKESVASHLYNTPHADTLVFQKLKQKNSFVPQKIAFSFDNRRHIDILPDGTINCIIASYPIKTEGFRGKISASQFRSLVQSVQQLPLPSMKSRYEPSAVCGETPFCISLLKKGSAKTFSASYVDDCPVALQFLYYKLVRFILCERLIPNPALRLEDVSAADLSYGMVIPERFIEFIPPTVAD